MHQTVIIEPWQPNAEEVHVHYPAKMGIHSRSADLAHNTDVQTVIRIGLISGSLKSYRVSCSLVNAVSGYQFIDSTNCSDFCKMIDAVANMDQKFIDLARGQIEEVTDWESEDEAVKVKLDDHEVAWLDYHVRELWMDGVQDCDNPFEDRIVLKYDMAAVVNDYIARQPKETH